MNSQEFPLHEACKICDIEKVKILIAEGVDLHAKNEDGYRAIDIAEMVGNLEIVELLISSY